MNRSLCRIVPLIFVTDVWFKIFALDENILAKSC